MTYGCQEQRLKKRDVGLVDGWAVKGLLRGTRLKSSFPLACMADGFQVCCTRHLLSVCSVAPETTPHSDISEVRLYIMAAW